MNNYLKIALSILFLVCLMDMPYGYYQMVRFIGAAGLTYLAWAEYEQRIEAFPFIWGAGALLLQPFIKIALGRTIWNIVDVTLAVLLIASIIYLDQLPSNQENEKPS